MTSVPVKIVRFADDSQPGWVECEFFDATGRRHAFVEKIPVVTKEALWRDSAFPCDGVIACEVVSTWVDGDGRSLTKVDTSRPWSVTSNEGLAEFVVLTTALRRLD